MAIFITDFDGTMTQTDFYRVALAHLLPAETPDFWDDYLAGYISHFAAMQGIMERIRGSEAVVLHAIEQMVLDPRAHEAVSALRFAGWNVRVASAGCRWYIDYLLAQQSLTLPVYANGGRYHPDHGLQLTAPVGEPYYRADTGVDKCAIVRAALAETDVVAFAGDGPPDLEPALLVPPARRFARGVLAERLTALGECYRTFTCWSEIAGYLLEDCHAG